MGVTSVTGEGGALWNYPDVAVEKPADDFTIFGLQAGLEYPNGTNANIDSGMWLHHVRLGSINRQSQISLTNMNRVDGSLHRGSRTPRSYLLWQSNVSPAFGHRLYTWCQRTVILLWE